MSEKTVTPGFTSGLKKRLWFSLGVIIFSIATLLPTIVGQDALPRAWFSDPIKLGLDLKGGIYLVFDVQAEEAVKSQLTAIAADIRAGLKKNNIPVLRSKVSGEREIEVTLLNDRNTAEVEKFMREDYPNLVQLGLDNADGKARFSYRFPDNQAQEIEKNAVDQAIETIRNRVDARGVAEPQIQRSGERQVIVQLPGISEKEFDSVKKTIGTVAKLDFYLVSNESTSGGMPTRSLPSREGGNIELEDEVLMSGDSIQTANVDYDPTTNEVGVSLRLTAAGGRRFDQITKDNVGRQLAIVLDGIVQSAPVIRERISGGSAQITGSFTNEEARTLKIVLQSGALPAPLKVEEQRAVGASLGEDSIRQGLKAMFVGAIAVVLFMIIYYRRAGILSVLALVLNIMFLVTLLALLEATLTFPGLAGLALTIGMAVDANVIIYERIRDELRSGATPSGAVTAGFHKAHWTIMDANLTTLLIGIVLYGFGTGPIKGFAVTLSLGILTTLFAALFITRLGFEVFKIVNQKGELSI